MRLNLNIFEIEPEHLQEMTSDFNVASAGLAHIMQNRQQVHQGQMVHQGQLLNQGQMLPTFPVAVAATSAAVANQMMAPHILPDAANEAQQQAAALLRDARALQTFLAEPMKPDQLKLLVKRVWPQLTAEYATVPVHSQELQKVFGEIGDCINW